MNTTGAAGNSLEGTARCVKCGLCLPHCPTFTLTDNEADSPRGRISLMQSLQRPGNDVSPGLLSHLDRCLQCGACEAMCPSNVPFGSLMDRAREQLEVRRTRPAAQRLARRLGLSLLTSPAGRRLAHTGLGALRITRLKPLLQKIPGLPDSLRRGLQLLPARRARAPLFPAVDRLPTTHRVQLFTGCTGELFDRETLRATRYLLTRLGYTIETPRRQTCCGALHRHNGDITSAEKLAAQNRSAFTGTDAIITIASGCQSGLLEADSPGAEDWRARVTDILEFLLSHGKNRLQFAPLRTRVAVHVPCSQRHGLRHTETAQTVLGWIPDLQRVELNPTGGCCGAAGSYMLSQPELSMALGEQMADAFIDSGADQLVTTNIGCALQLRAALEARGHQPDVVHPVSLLAQQLARKDSD